MAKDETFRKQWPVYSDDVQEATYPYPHGGYDALLEEMWVRSGQPGQGVRVLDLNLGEGDLASQFHLEGCEVTGILHEEDGEDVALMERVMARLPGVSVIRGERAGGPRAGGGEAGEEGSVAALLACHGECESSGPFDVVVWSYDLRGVCDEEGFVAIVEEVFERCIEGKKGVMVVGCVSFEHEEDRLKYEGREEDKKRALVFDKIKGALIQRRLRVQYTQLYPCAGLYKIKRR